MYRFSLFAIVALAGCGTVSEIVAVDADTYMVASHGVLGNGSSAVEKVKAVKVATEFCERKNQTLRVIQIESVDPFFGRAPSADVRFRCVKS